MEGLNCYLDRDYALYYNSEGSGLPSCDTEYFILPVLPACISRSTTGRRMLVSGKYWYETGTENTEGN